MDWPGMRTAKNKDAARKAQGSQYRTFADKKVAWLEN